MEARVYEIDWALPDLDWARYDCVDNIYFHMDCDGYYAGCEISENPKLRGLPMVVGGSQEARHGIVLAKSQEAKKFGIKTADTLFKARQKCAQLVTVPVHFDLYERMTGEHHDIASRYGVIQPYGPDEQWLSLGRMKYSDAIRLARELQQAVWDELGITASIGVSYNRIMAKLASDYQKPMGLTVIRREDVPHMVWPRPAGDLFMVGPATVGRLEKYGIKTIGDIARCDSSLIRSHLHSKNGEMIWAYANGIDFSSICDKPSPIKSIGNSATFPRDLMTMDDVTAGLWILSESVARRLRLHSFRAQTAEIYVRDKFLNSFTRQMTLKKPTLLANELHEATMQLFLRNVNLLQGAPIRSLGVRGTNLKPEGLTQLSFLPEEIKRQKTEAIERSIDEIRSRFGHFAIRRGSLMLDSIGEVNPFDVATVLPAYYM